MASLYTVVWEDDKGRVPIGYMPQHVYEKYIRVSMRIKGELDFYMATRTLSILRDRPTEPERTETMAKLTSHWRENQTFRILKGWRDELWPVYGNDGELLFSMERIALGLFGVVRYGVHMTAYVEASEASYGIKIWVPKRAADKSTYPGMLDNTVAGGLMTGEDPFECLVREADEEASLPEAVVRSGAKAAGTVSHLYITDERSGEAGYVYPEVEWIYDLLLPADVTPAPQDGEVESFSLCTVDEVREDMALGLFKPNCAVVLLDFFIRHGILTRDNEPDFDEIVRRVHRTLPFPLPHGDFGQKANP